MKNLRLLYISIVLFASCSQPVEYVEVDKEVVVTETVEVAVDRSVDNVVNTESIVYIEKEVYIMAKEKIVIDPIKEYDNYITTDNKVFGVVKDGFEEIPLIKGLFKINGVIYFKTNVLIKGDKIPNTNPVEYVKVSTEKLCTQKDGVLTELEEADFPLVPVGDFVTFASGDYKIEKSVYKDEPISMVFNGSPRQSHYMVDGACLRGKDMIYSCPIDTGNRYKGIWIWTVNGNPLRIMEDGRIW